MAIAHPAPGLNQTVFITDENARGRRTIQKFRQRHRKIAQLNSDGLRGDSIHIYLSVGSVASASKSLNATSNTPSTLLRDHCQLIPDVAPEDHKVPRRDVVGTSDNGIAAYRNHDVGVIGNHHGLHWHGFGMTAVGPAAIVESSQCIRHC